MGQKAEIVRREDIKLDRMHVLSENSMEDKFVSLHFHSVMYHFVKHCVVFEHFL